MSKKKETLEQELTYGEWVYRPGATEGVSASKVFGAGDIREVWGVDQEEAETNAAEVDRIAAMRLLGQRNQNAARAQELRDEADRIENSV